MTVYKVPEEPEDIKNLYDRGGNLWIKEEEGYWLGESYSLRWKDLINIVGPMSTDRPIKIGDIISFDEFWRSHVGTVVKENNQIAMTRIESGVSFGERTITRMEDFAPTYFKFLRVLDV